MQFINIEYLFFNCLEDVFFRMILDKSKIQVGQKHVCKNMYACMSKVALVVLPMEKGSRLDRGERSLGGPFFPTPQAPLARVTLPTANYRHSSGSAANFALGTKGWPRGHFDQPGIPRPSMDPVWVSSFSVLFPATFPTWPTTPFYPHSKVSVSLIYRLKKTLVFSLQKSIQQMQI